VKITFLGTGPSLGIPIIGCDCVVCSSDDSKDKRLRSSIYVENGEKSILIDSGPDFRYQMLRENIRSLNAILLTHEHKDHIAGLDDIRSFNYINRSPMDIYAESRVLKAIQESYSYVFADYKYPGIPQMNLIPISKEKYKINGFDITPITVMHHELPVLGFRINNFTYISDASFIADEEKDKISGSEILIINALRRTKHVSHFCLEESLAIIEEINPGIAYLTHFGHMIGLHQDLENELPANVFPAYDGLKITV